MFSIDARHATALSLAFAAVAAAQPHSGDIVVRLNAAQDRLVTGIADEDTGEVTMGARVFAAAFEPGTDFTNEPGFDSGPGELPFPSEIGFTIRRAMRVWDGSAFVVIPPERISVRNGPFGPVLTPTTDTPIVGFSLPVNSDGEFHHHLGYALQPPAGAGIYLYEATLWSTRAAIAESLPFFIVFNQGSPQEDHDAALEWVVQNLLGDNCPADFNTDGFVTGDDFDAYVTEFVLGNPSTDFNRDGFVTGDDFDSFVVAFEQGC